MADPLSITGLVLQLAVTLKQLYDYGKEVKGAQQEIRSLCSELSALKSILEDLEKQNDKAVNLTDGLYDALLTAKTVLDAFLSRLTAQSSKLKQKLQSLQWPFKKDEVKDLLDRLERLKTLFLLMIMGDTQAATQELKPLRDDVRLIVDVLQKAEVRQAKKEAEQVSEGLVAFVAPESPTTVHRTACSVWRKSPSGSWFINDKLKPWLEKPDPSRQILHLSGISGAGKTTLMSRAVEYLKTCHESTLSAFFYCTYNNAATQEVRNIFGSWIAQLSPEDASILEPFKAYISGENEIPQEVFENAIIAVAKRHMSVVLVLDAMNESRECSELVDRITKLCGRCQSVRLVVSSTLRTTSLFPKKSKLCYEVDMAPSLVQADISDYIISEIRKHEILQSIPEDEIVAAVLPKANGMFRWATCQMSLLTKEETPRMVRRAMVDLPKTLHDTYFALLQRVSPTARNFVREALRWSSFSLRPLLLKELAEAAVVEPGDTTIDDDCRLQPSHILKLCQGLIVLDEVTDRVALAHGSIRTFLTSDDLHLSDMSYFWLDTRDSVVSITAKCLTYLMMDHFRIGACRRGTYRPLPGQYPLLGYASGFWAAHFRFICQMDEPCPQPLFDQALRFFRTHKEMPSGGNFGFWARTLMPWKTTELVQKSEPLYYASSFGLRPVVKYWLKNGEIDTKNPAGQWYIDHKCGQGESTALQVACVRAHPKIVQLLLQYGADPNSTGNNGMTCLEWAVSRDRTEIARLLREAGAKETPFSFSSQGPVASATIVDWRDIVTEIRVPDGPDNESRRDASDSEDEQRAAK